MAKRRFCYLKISLHIYQWARSCSREPGKVPQEIIEIQSGTYLGEDDVVRFEDLYGRVESEIKL